MHWSNDTSALCHLLIEILQALTVVMETAVPTLSCDTQLFFQKTQCHVGHRDHQLTPPCLPWAHIIFVWVQQLRRGMAVRGCTHCKGVRVGSHGHGVQLPTLWRHASQILI